MYLTCEIGKAKLRSFTPSNFHFWTISIHIFSDSSTKVIPPFLLSPAWHEVDPVSAQSFHAAWYSRRAPIDNLYLIWAANCILWDLAVLWIHFLCQLGLVNLTLGLSPAQINRDVHLSVNWASGFLTVVIKQPWLYHFESPNKVQYYIVDRF